MVATACAGAADQGRTVRKRQHVVGSQSSGEAASPPDRPRPRGPRGADARGRVVEREGAKGLRLDRPQRPAAGGGGGQQRELDRPARPLRRADPALERRQPLERPPLLQARDVRAPGQGAAGRGHRPEGSEDRPRQVGRRAHHRQDPRGRDVRLGFRDRRGPQPAHAARSRPLAHRRSGRARPGRVQPGPVRTDLHPQPAGGGLPRLAVPGAREPGREGTGDHRGHRRIRRRRERLHPEERPTDPALEPERLRRLGGADRRDLRRRGRGRDAPRRIPGRAADEDGPGRGTPGLGQPPPGQGPRVAGVRARHVLLRRGVRLGHARKRGGRRRELHSRSSPAARSSRSTVRRA